MDTPSTDELDAVALYIITARELRDCRFFIEEHHQLSISYRQGDPPEAVRGHFPDPDTVSAALLPFRKLWMKDELCFYRRVANIIKRYCADLRWLVDLSFSLNTNATRFIPFLRDVELSTEDVIDLWLNTRYMHIGPARHKGRFTREDFNNWETQIGATLFEYYFLSSVWQVGLLFFNILRDSEAFLKWCELQGWKPIVEIQSEVNPHVTRSTPGFEQVSDSKEQMAWRLRRRRKYAGFAAFLERTKLSDATIVEYVCECETFSAFCDAMGIGLEQLETLEGLNMDDIVFSSGALDEHSNVVRLGRIRKGLFFVTEGGNVKWNDDWLELVSEQYDAFREVLRAE
jgi:hypothetical protein